jgi:hypothetical protein
MFFITSDQEFGLSRSSTFQDAVIIIVGCHDGNPACGLRARVDLRPLPF